MKRILFFLTVLAISIVHDSAYSQNSGDSAHKIMAHNLGADINSGAVDFGAYEDQDRLTLYFVSRRTTHASRVDQFWFVSRTSPETPWSKPQYLKSFNMYDHPVGGFCRDDNGKIFFATQKESSSGANDMDIWEGEIVGNTLKVNPLPNPVNTTNWESQPSISGNGKDLYFAANRGSYGLKATVDIFLAHKNPDNSWTAPVKLCPKINFGSYNATPYITPDGAFLFFASNGTAHSKRKLYMAKRTGPKDDDWSDAIMLPSDINSDSNELFPMIAHDGKTIYFTSDRKGGYGELDIYEAALPTDIQAKIAKSFHRN